eukprot:7220001-Prorocentrum_lima.AAC.1
MTEGSGATTAYGQEEDPPLDVPDEIEDPESTRPVKREPRTETMTWLDPPAPAEPSTGITPGAVPTTAN